MAWAPGILQGGVVGALFRIQATVAGQASLQAPLEGF